MLYDTATYYNLQALQENTTPLPWGQPGRERVTVEIRPWKARRGVFRGSAALPPGLGRFRASWALLGGLAGNLLVLPLLLRFADGQDE